MQFSNELTEILIFNTLGTEVVKRRDIMRLKVDEKEELHFKSKLVT